MECFKCGISGDRALLFDVISDKGIVKICRKCSLDESMPIIRRAENFQDSNSRSTVREQLSKTTGTNPPRKVGTIKSSARQDENLKEIVSRNFEKKVKGKKPRPDLINNFHWIIMRARRSKKITQKNLAEDIGEPETAIKLAEQGIVPDGYQLVDKFENYLGIQIRKEKKPESPDLDLVKQSRVLRTKHYGTQQLDFDLLTTKSLTISDLQEMKQKREDSVFSREEIQEENDFSDEIYEPDLFAEEIDEDKPEFSAKGDLSKEEIDDLIFKRKG